MLIAFGGLPGTGKTTIARCLAHRLSAVYLRIDTIEQALIGADMSPAQIGPSGYMAAYAIAADNLRLDRTVVADSVNALTITREAWQNVARRVGVPCFEVELICSDPAIHRTRVESRAADIPGHVLPNWQRVLTREYTPWTSPHLIIDTTQVSAEQAIDIILQYLKQR